MRLLVYSSSLDYFHRYFLASSVRNTERAIFKTHLLNEKAFNVKKASS